MPARLELTREYMLSRCRITETGCWEWTLCVDAYGYGALTVGQKRLRASVAAYRLWIGPVPSGLSVLHECDNRRCFRPEHIYAGTKAQNSADMVARGRQRNQFLPSVDIGEFRDRVRDLRRAGVSFERIGAWLACAPMTVHRVASL